MDEKQQEINDLKKENSGLETDLSTAIKKTGDLQQKINKCSHQINDKDSQQRKSVDEISKLKTLLI